MFNHPIVQCLKNPDLTVVSTPDEEIEESDFGIVNEAYGCLKWTIEYKELDFSHPNLFADKTKVIYVHPKWSLGDAVKYIKQSVGPIGTTLQKKVSGSFTEPIVLTADGYGDNAVVTLKP